MVEGTSRDHPVRRGEMRYSRISGKTVTHMRVEAGATHVPVDVRVRRKRSMT